MKPEYFKYAAFALMGIYVLNRTKGQGMGEDYLKLTSKADLLIDQLTKNMSGPQAEQVKALAKGAAKVAIESHMNVRTLK